MTQEEKQLLLKDLCARFPYDVKFSFCDGYDNEVFTLSNLDGILKYDIENECTVRAYLRPMSSMTEEEEEEYDSMFSNARRIYCNCAYYDTVQEDDIPDFIDWLLEHHFDYRGLIPMGLALEAPEGMYEIK